MATCILIFLASLQIIWAEDPTKDLLSSKAEAPPINPEIKKEIVDIFKRNGPKSVPPSATDRIFETFNSSPIRNSPNTYKGTYHQPYSEPVSGGYGPSNYNGLYQEPYQDTYADYRSPKRPRLPKQVERIPINATFSIFEKEHKQALLSLVKHFEAIDDLEPDIKKIIQYTKEVKPYINVYLYQEAVSNFLRNKGMGGYVPPVSERYPEKFVSIQGLQMIIDENKNLTVGRKRRQVVWQDTVDYRRFNGGIQINQRLDLSGDDYVREHRVAYFREDYGLNSHHDNWHLDNQKNRVPRYMEYFIYMHAQMVRRYNAERLAVGLPPVMEYSNFYSPIEIGHLPNIGWTRRDYGVREDYMTPSDHVWGANFNRQMQLKSNLEYQIAMGNDDDDRFMAALEEYHDLGHNNIGWTITNRGDSPNVMYGASTSARDNVFYRWHQHIDDLYEEYTEMTRNVNRRRFEIWEMAFEDIELKSISIENKRNKRQNELVTGCGKHHVDVTNGLDLEQVNYRFIIEMVHLDHVPFSYNIQYNNKDRIVKSGIVRIFLAPTYDESGNRMRVEKQRRYWIEMDKFKYNFKPGKGTLERNSSESTVTVDCRKDSEECVFPFTYEGTTYDRCVSWSGGRDWCSTKTDAWGNHDGRHWKYCNDDPDDRDGQCRCGWPQHLLVPRGTPHGMKFMLFVIVTKERNIQSWNEADNSHSTYCGFEGQVLSDRRPMGFPFHAPAPQQITRIQDFPQYLGNSAVSEVSIRYHGGPTNPHEEPVKGCGISG